MKIRPLTLATVLIGTVALAGCGSGSGGLEAKKSGKLKIGFIYSTTTQNPFQEMAYGAKAAAAADGNVTLNASAPTGVNGPVQVELFRSAIRSSTDGIALQALAPDLFTRPLVQATENEIPTVAVDAAAPPGTKTNLFVGNSNTEVGRTLGEEFIKHVPAGTKGDLVIGNPVPGLPVLEQRVKGIIEVVKKERPTLTIKGPFDTKSEPTANYNAWNALVKNNPKAIGFLGVGAQAGVSLPLIKKQTGRKFLAGSCDLEPAALKAVKEGSLFALASPEHWLKGYIATEMMVRSRRDGKKLPEGWWNPGTLIVNSGNVDDVMKRQANEQTRIAFFKAIADKQLAEPGKYLKPLKQAN
ncbi:ribose transport system substrate-binding protein [Actinomadura pelletieri DSM 43383]|uniref:Ribose transport system substrate-binding protein n=1 Tax=Actinomadura pelletieri DSM 43383 TaxID=1120940 RepID=A0A495QSR5_9ACTN|nr:sugar ABC transporter substrate-binding protein [Actinomadura pelletieri]RKS76545.1 ribose transport system substrate-binding protein [Actinomadura pelletieri DSM 43383]